MISEEKYQFMLSEMKDYGDELIAQIVDIKMRYREQEDALSSEEKLVLLTFGKGLHEALGLFAKHVGNIAAKVGSEKHLSIDYATHTYITEEEREIFTNLVKDLEIE